MSLLAKATAPVAPPKSRFNGFGLEYTRPLTDDYVQKKFLTAKYSAKGAYFTFSGKGTLDFKLGADKKETPVTSSEVKLLTNVEGRTVETKFDNKGQIRVWSHLGVYDIGRPLIVTGKVKTNNSFSRLSGNLCLEYVAPNLNVLTRLDIKDGGHPYFNEKMLFRFGKTQLGYVVKFNLLAHTLARYNFFLAHHEKDFSVYAEHISRNKEKFQLGKFILAGVYKRAGIDYAVKGSYRPHKTEQIRVKAGVVTTVNKTSTLRAKINNNAKLALSSKFKYSSNLSVVAATQVNLLNPGSFLTNRAVPVPLGLSLEFSYN